MKTQINPAVFAVILAVVVIAIGVFLFQRASVNPPTPRPDAKYFTGGAATPTKP